MDRFNENLALAGFFMALLLLSAWLQFGLLKDPENEISEIGDNDPDYYVENFTSAGMGGDGSRYRLNASRLAHYPVGDRALLDNLHIIQYGVGDAPRHIYAESGWLYNNRSTVLLTGNVRVIQGRNGSPGDIARSERMLIHLKENRD